MPPSHDGGAMQHSMSAESVTTPRSLPPAVIQTCPIRMKEKRE